MPLTVRSICYDPLVLLLLAAALAAAPAKISFEQASVFPNDDTVWATRFSPDGKRLYTSGLGERILVWDVEKKAYADQIPVPYAIHLALDKAGRLMAAGSPNGLSIVEPAARRITAKLEHPASQSLFSGTISPDGKKIAAGFRDGDILLGAVPPAGKPKVLKGHKMAVQALAFSPDGRVLAAGGRDGKLSFWDAKTGRRTGLVQAHTHQIIKLEFSPDGTSLATTARDQSVRVWSVKTRSQRRVLFSTKERLIPDDFDQRGAGGVIHNSPEFKRLTDQALFGLAYSGDGAMIAATIDNTTLRVWDTRTGEVLGELKDSGEHVYGVSLSGDGSLLAFGSGKSALLYRLKRN